MKDIELQIINAELVKALTNGRFGKVFQLGRFEIAIDFIETNSGYLFISIEPAAPRIYLIKRRLKELEKSSSNPTPFALLLKKYLSGAIVTSIDKIDGERVIVFRFAQHDELGKNIELSLVVQLTGRSANLFLLDGDKAILASSRESTGIGQELGETYSVPERPVGAMINSPDTQPNVVHGQTLSETLDRQYLEKEAEKQIAALANSALSKIKTSIKNRERLVAKLNKELGSHGDAERWKHYGDLLLANISTAKRKETGFSVIDYFDENLPEIIISADANDSPSEAAEKYFRKYSKAKTAAVEIKKRLAEANNELEDLAREKAVIDKALKDKDVIELSVLAGIPKVKATAKQAAKQSLTDSAVKKFISSDGFEILVGKKAKDNDHLTMRVAKSLDTWMHAADYPGSHVVVRARGKDDIPQRTLIEAAQLAAFYSKARGQTKAAVNYTLKKFVNKPKGSPPGVVNLSSFKTLLVEPGVNIKPV